MKKSHFRPLWLRKRFILPLCFILGLPLAATIAVIRSDVSTIVIYNNTGEPLPPLLVGACQQTKTFSSLQDQESVRFYLKPNGPAGPVHLEVASSPPWTWDGRDAVQCHGGYRVSIRLEAGHQVEAYTEFSWWQRNFFNILSGR